jgi:prevent-host-death family protein
MTIFMVMVKVNVFEIKAKLSEYLDRAVNGERVVICRHNKPVAELRSIEEVRAEPRPTDALPGRPRFDVPTSFFDPLPDEDLDLWDGGATAGTSAAAEAKPRYGPRPGRSIKRRRS